MTQGTPQENQNLPVLVVRSEEDAYKLLQSALADQVGPWGDIRFEGWPKLEIYLKGPNFDQSLTPPVMKSLLEFQKAIYQSFASAKYGSPTKRLTDEEKSALEIKVKVEKGSSDLTIDFQELAVEFVKQIGGKMDSQHILIAVLTFTVLYFGQSYLRSFLETRKEIRLREVSDETQRKALELMQFQSAAETDRLKILTEALGPNPRLQNMAGLAHDATTDLLKGLGQAEVARVDGVELSGKAAVSLVHNARRKSEEVRLDGLYRLVKLDWSDPSKFRVKVYGVETGLELDAEVQDDSLTGNYKDLLKQAEWSRSPVKLMINARRIADEYRGAVIIKVESAQLDPAAPAHAS